MLIVAVVVFGWLRALARAVGRMAAGSRPTAATSSTPGPWSSATSRLLAATAPRSTAAPAARPAAGPSGPPRTTSPTRRVPAAAAPANPGGGFGLTGGGLIGLDAGPPPDGPGRAVVEALRRPASLRTAVVLAELLGPPVALR